MTGAELKAMHAEMTAKADELWAEAQPLRDALAQAQEPWHTLQDVIETLLDEHEAFVVGGCEGCNTPIFEGDPYTYSDPITLCATCSPTWQDMLNEPGSFEDSATGEQMTRDAAQAYCDTHVAGGGKLTDTMATP